MSPGRSASAVAVADVDDALGHGEPIAQDVGRAKLPRLITTRRGDRAARHRTLDAAAERALEPRVNLAKPVLRDRELGHSEYIEVTSTASIERGWTVGATSYQPAPSFCFVSRVERVAAVAGSRCSSTTRSPIASTMAIVAPFRENPEVCPPS